jgi:hypothetical protein
MKSLVVFDGTRGAEQNLRLALAAANVSETAAPEVLVCVLQLLREDQPLDDYLADMEQASERAIEAVGRIVGQTGCKAGITLTLLKGMELEAAELIAYQAADWQADQIYLGLDQDCVYCKEETPRRSNFFGFFKKPKTTEAQAAELTPTSYSHQPISIDSLLALATCPLKITCHGEVLFSLYEQKARIRAKQLDL